MQTKITPSLITDQLLAEMAEPDAQASTGEFYRYPIRCYKDLWNSINGTDAWDANPWVDVTNFEVLQQNIEGVAA